MTPHRRFGEPLAWPTGWNSAGMASEELPHWVSPWCQEHLGDEPVEVLFALQQMSTVVGLRLADGTNVVVKAREDDGRAKWCVVAQAQLAESGFPCPRPLTAAITEGRRVVHAEAFRPGGEALGGDSPETAARDGAVFARIMSALVEVRVPPPLPNPRWVRWDHQDAGLWPAVEFLDERDQDLVPAFVVEAAQRARARLLAADLSCVLGHADFEAQNLRWRDGEVWVVHDWDSLAWQPEAALVGAASGSFPRLAGRPPILPPIASSERFLADYQGCRQRWLSTEELQVAWAASVWSAAHHARWEALLSSRTPVTTSALRAQAAERLERAGA